MGKRKLCEMDMSCFVLFDPQLYTFFLSVWMHGYIDFFFLLTDYTRIKILIAPYVMRSRAHARHRGLIAWWEGDTKREKEDERLKNASGTVLSNDRVRSRLLGKHKFDAKELFPT